jgi:hypothetical protein
LIPSNEEDKSRDPLGSYFSTEDGSRRGTAVEDIEEEVGKCFNMTRPYKQIRTL